MPLSRTRVFDRLGSAALLLLYAAAIAGQAMAMARNGAPRMSALDIATVASELATIAFLSLQFSLILLRRPAQRRAEGWGPLVVTWASVALPALFVALPRAPPNAALQFVSVIVLTCGMAASIYVLTYLGRCFSLLPQARGLVTIGPYAWVRHPLYVAELVATAGVMLQFAQPYALGLYLLTAIALTPRMGFEESVLRGAFPAYGDYMRRTRRLIPGVY